MNPFSQLETKNLDALFAGIKGYFSPLEIGGVNGLKVNLARIRGEYHWHKHETGEETFFVCAGELNIHYKNGEDVELKEGEFHTVPRGEIHKTSAREECRIIFIGPEEKSQV